VVNLLVDILLSLIRYNEERVTHSPFSVAIEHHAIELTTLKYITIRFGSNPAHGEVYLIQHYVIKFVIDLRQVSGFSQGTPVSSINKTDRHDII
jgi:hypothetical protein